MKQKLIILRGLPASGKTTWSKQYTEDNKLTMRVCRDDIRAMLTPNFIYGSSQEDIVTKIEEESIYAALLSGYSVVIDATNFCRIERFEFICEWCSQLGNNIELEIKEFNTDLKICIQRDQQRDNPVGKKVIEGMYNKYLKNE